MIFSNLYKKIKGFKKKRHSDRLKHGFDNWDIAYHMSLDLLYLVARYSIIIAVIVGLLFILNKNAGYFVLIMVFGGLGWILFKILRFILHTSKKQNLKNKIDTVVNKQLKEFGSEIPKKIDYDLKYSLEEEMFYPKYEKETIPLSKQKQYYREIFKKIVKLEDLVKQQKPIKFNYYDYNVGFFKLLQEKLGVEINHKDYERVHLAYYSLPSYIEEVRQSIGNTMKSLLQENQTKQAMKFSLDALSAEEDIVYLENIRLKSNGEIFETDLLLFSQYGVFVLDLTDIQNINDFQIRVTATGQWVKVLKNGSSEPLKVKPSRLSENVPLLEHLFSQYEKETGVSTPKIQSTIIVPRNIVLVENESNISICDNIYFRTQLVLNEQKYDMNELRKLAVWLDQQKLPEEEVEVSNCVDSLIEINETLVSLGNQYEKAMDLHSKIDKELDKDLSRRFKDQLSEKGRKN